MAIETIPMALRRIAKAPNIWLPDPSHHAVHG
jgi:hypothetical protein